MWKDALDSGGRVFVRRGNPLPEGFEFVEDKIGDVRFPAASGEGMVQIQAGEQGDWKPFYEARQRGLLDQEQTRQLRRDIQLGP